ncbi:unnamed protein product, partial [Didymodactylos carnosus]
VGPADQNLFDQVWPVLRIWARASPEDQYLLVQHITTSKINRTREVVAVIGSATNDATALKNADLQLMVNAVAVSYVLIGACIVHESPLKPLKLVCGNSTTQSPLSST